jgi:hypothetical protein
MTSRDRRSHAVPWGLLCATTTSSSLVMSLRKDVGRERQLELRLAAGVGWMAPGTLTEPALCVGDLQEQCIVSAEMHCIDSRF